MLFLEFELIHPEYLEPFFFLLSLSPEWSLGVDEIYEIAPLIIKLSRFYVLMKFLRRWLRNLFPPLLPLKINLLVLLFVQLLGLFRLDYDSTFLSSIILLPVVVKRDVWGASWCYFFKGEDFYAFFGESLELNLLLAFLFITCPHGVFKLERLLLYFWKFFVGGYNL